MNQTKKNVVWNLAGVGLPLAAAFASIPFLINYYGSEGFGVLSIVWAFVGYFSIFDLGLSRALSQIISEKIGKKESNQLPSIIKTGLLLSLSLGVLAAIVSFFVAPIVISWLKISNSLINDVRSATFFLSLGLPFVVFSVALMGVLEAYEKFLEINVIRIFMGLGNFLMPVAAGGLGLGLVEATLGIVAVRFLTTIMYFALIVVDDDIELRGKFDAKISKMLFGFGAWVTVSNVISPILVQVDKFVVGATVGVKFLPIYSVPADMFGRMSFIPSAFIGAIFPKFVKCWSASNEEGLMVFKNTCNLMIKFSIIFLFIIIFSVEKIFSIWIGDDFAKSASGVFVFLAIGFVFNSVARVPSMFVSAVGRPDLAAKMHIIELPVYTVLLYYFLVNFGVVGAAIGWCFRMALDMWLLFVCVGFYEKRLSGYCFWAPAFVTSGGGFLLLVKYFFDTGVF